MTYTPTVWVDGDCVMAADMNNIEQGVDRAQGDVMILRGATAAIPASDPLLVGRLYFESDLLQRVWRDNGGGWDQVHAVAGAGGAWTLIQEVALGAPAAVVTFAAIAGTYRHLVLFYSLRTDNPDEWDVVIWRANADAGNNYDWRFADTGMGATNAGNRAQPACCLGRAEGANSTANTFARGRAEWPYYDETVSYKRMVSTTAIFKDLSGNIDCGYTEVSGQWRNSGAITSLTFLSDSGANFVTNSRFALYGIA